MAYRVEGRDNGRTAWVYQNDVGVECGMCGHRGLVPLTALKVGSGDMSRLIDRRFKCAPCGSQFVALYLFAKPEEADAFAATAGPPSSGAGS